ncbi:MULTISPECIES: hypothetical protein [unclassified Francisella]|nr:MULTISPECIES: hypothetical protein [unclassified Francisella]MED7820382.1 hypothetical protein [Francisella sp. 19S2-4]MED7831217.1 hypothetical protein [Francisella sp. 19S2-10]
MNKIYNFLRYVKKGYKSKFLIILVLLIPEASMQITINVNNIEKVIAISN